jgi:hypothetical protein
MSKEKERLATMLRENKISEKDYQLLVEALDKKRSKVRQLLSLLINPFEKIAGYPALGFGLGLIVMMSYVGVLAKVYFPGILECLNAAVVTHPKRELNFLLLLSQNLSSWLLLTVIFIVATKILTKQSIRIIDFFGTVALSRYPYLVLTGVIAIIQWLNPAFMHVDLTKGFPIEPSVAMSAFGIFTIMCWLWQLTTYFFALKESSGLSGRKLWGGFIASIVAGEALSFPIATLLM